ncbi:unnamed protein product [Caenorhabditis angaria]|uniref:Serpentine Receptor, class H n=1 Tax=Caenorhabditis angaria TaxID=860376 RepID=A0A9P1MVW8_9PELO|nr:unnamed protein product [Caenorhabditis angaria]
MCSEVQLVLATPIFYKNVLHYFSIISTPINCFAVYCIIFKTPKSVDSARICMLLLSFCSSLLDFEIGILLTPFILFPTISGYSLGFFSFFQVKEEIQIFSTLVVFIATSASIICLLENRFSQLNNTYKLKNSLIISVSNVFIGSISILIILKDLPDQNEASEQIFNSLPCLTKIESKNLFILSLDIELMGFLISATTLAFCIQGIFFVLATFQRLYFHKALNLSAHTRKLQKSFFLAICLQVSIPIMVILIPCVYIAVSCLSHYHNQALNNLAIITICFHGTLSSISMIFVHNCYRHVLLRLLLTPIKQLAKKHRHNIVSILF